ncbi:unnamed protein product [Nezara viridula]|uniref:Uncharacterized protein n=1 Tax=Nezara viridula TaxID=85310 RepID=A0A9P0E4B7_NEZVI|nr:unnamed protein product [Nezara viridula]
MQVYQVVYHRNGNSRRILKMNKVSCFDCNRFPIGFHEINSGVDISNTFEVDKETSALHPCSLLETKMCVPEAPIDTQPQGILTTEGTSSANHYGQPKEGSSIMARFDGNKEYRYVCCLTKNDQFFLRPCDIFMELPAPKVKIQNRRILRVFPFDLEVVEKE